MMPGARFESRRLLAGARAEEVAMQRAQLPAEKKLSSWSSAASTALQELLLEASFDRVSLAIYEELARVPGRLERLRAFRPLLRLQEHLRFEERTRFLSSPVEPFRAKALRRAAT
jgi:hypothetical protein